MERPDMIEINDPKTAKLDAELDRECANLCASFYAAEMLEVLHTQASKLPQELRRDAIADALAETIKAVVDVWQIKAPQDCEKLQQKLTAAIGGGL